MPLPFIDSLSTSTDLPMLLPGPVAQRCNLFFAAAEQWPESAPAAGDGAGDENVVFGWDPGFDWGWGNLE